MYNRTLIYIFYGSRAAELRAKEYQVPDPGSTTWGEIHSPAARRVGRRHEPERSTQRRPTPATEDHLIRSHLAVRR